MPPSAAAAAHKPAGSYRLLPHGLDCVQLRLAAGPAEPLKPLAAVASGGESARIMLVMALGPVY